MSDETPALSPDVLRRAPKVLLHDHLDGGLRPATVAELAEAHGYAGRETLLHILAERINWFDKYVKNAPPREKQETAAK